MQGRQTLGSIGPSVKLYLVGMLSVKLCLVGIAQPYAMRFYQHFILNSSPYGMPFVKLCLVKKKNLQLLLYSHMQCFSTKILFLIHLLMTISINKKNNWPKFKQYQNFFKGYLISFSEFKNRKLIFKCHNAFGKINIQYTVVLQLMCFLYHSNQRQTSLQMGQQLRPEE